MCISSMMLKFINEKPFRGIFQIFYHRFYNLISRYNVRWYIAPLYIQRMILFLLQRNSRNFSLNVGGLFVASIECFATV